MKPMLVAAGWSVELHDEHFEQDAPDVVWLPAVAASGRVILTRDKRISRRPDELLAIVESGARVLFVGFEGNTRSYVSALLAGESRIQAAFDDLGPPVALKLHRDGTLQHTTLPSRDTE